MIHDMLKLLIRRRHGNGSKNPSLYTLYMRFLSAGDTLLHTRGYLIDYIIFKCVSYIIETR